MGEVFFGIPTPLARALIEGLQLQAAVETGTHLGDTAAALSDMVEQVSTVELSHEYVERAKARHAERPQITFLEGSSPAVLADLAPSLERAALFWLDAHWCEADTAGYEAQCPVLAEIEAIDTAPCAERSVILIDDARFFLGCPWPTYRRSDWPSFMEVVDRLRARYPRYVTTLMDVIIAGPPEAREVVERFWQAKVFADLMNKSENGWREVEVLRGRLAAAESRLSQAESHPAEAGARETKDEPGTARLLARRVLPVTLRRELLRLSRRS
jgi:hypothetical protein